MGELTLLVLRLAFLVLMWVFVFAIVYALRSDLFGQRVRRMPQTAAADDLPGHRIRSPAPAAAAAPVAPATEAAPSATPRDRRHGAAPRHHLGAAGGRRGRPSGRAIDHRTLERIGAGDPRRLHLDAPRAPHALER